MNSNLIKFLSLLYLLLLASALSTPMEVSYNNKYIYTSVLNIPISNIFIDTQASRTREHFSIAFPASLKHIQSASVIMSLGDVELDIPLGVAELIRGVSRGSSFFNVTLASSTFHNFRVLGLRYLIMSGMFSPISNPNIAMLSFNYRGIQINSSKLGLLSVPIPKYLNRTGGVGRFCAIAGFTLQSMSKKNIIDVDIKIFKMNSTKLTFHIYSHSQTSTKVKLLQISALLYNVGVMNGEEVGRFQNYGLEVDGFGEENYLQYFNRGNVLNFTTMIGVTGFHAQDRLQFSTAFTNPDNFKIFSTQNISSTQSNNYLSINFILMATFYCSYETPYYYEVNKRCYDQCPGKTIRNEADLTCDGDAIVDGMEFPCPNGCAACSKDTRCISCYLGFVLEGQTCREQ